MFGQSELILEISQSNAINLFTKLNDCKKRTILARVTIQFHPRKTLKNPLVNSPDTLIKPIKQTVSRDIKSLYFRGFAFDAKSPCGGIKKKRTLRPTRRGGPKFIAGGFISARIFQSAGLRTGKFGFIFVDTDYLPRGALFLQGPGKVLHGGDFVGHRS